MRSLWNKSDVFEYWIPINTTLVSIRTHEDNLKIAKFPQNCDIQDKVTIWFDSDISQMCIQRIREAFESGDEIMPDSICLAYKYLGLAPKQMEKHINKYVLFDDIIYAHYAFPSDDFYLMYATNQKDIYLWGNKPNLERILISILSMTGSILPFHAACIQYNKKGYMIIGDSSSGKTAISLEMLKRGAAYISDDTLYIDKDMRGIRCNSYLSLQNKYVKSEMKNAIEVVRADKTFLDIDELCSENDWIIQDNSPIDKILLISPLTVDNATCTKLFCTFRHDSMFALEYLEGDIREKLDVSILYWKEMLKKVSVKEISINYKEFNISINAICDKIFT